MTVNLKVPDLRELKPRITVFGVGGAGSNAVNNMIRSGLEGVDFVVANTDAQALMASKAERRIQMGVRLTQGLGAGSHPEIGRSAAEEALEEIRTQLQGSHMVFITAGMGGGTGTGAAPVIAAAAREEGILTVGVVTKPFQFEGQRRLRTAEAGIIEMQKHVDTLIVIPNQNLFRIANDRTTFAEAFAMADEVLYSGVACITSVIVKEGLINLDFADVRAVMSEMGKAMMGTGEATGDRRAIEAAESAISNPLLDDVSMIGARGLLISISGGSDLTLYEVDEAATRIREEVDPEANIIMGATFDETLEGTMRVSVVATGIDADQSKQIKEEGCEAKDKRCASSVNFELQGIDNPVMPLGKEAATGSSGRHAQEKSFMSVSVGEDFSLQEVNLSNQDKRMVHTYNAFQSMQVDSLTEEGVVSAHQEISAIVDEKHFIPPIAEHSAMRAPLMPSLEDFPIPGQNELRVRSGKESEMGLSAYHRKTGFFQRLVGMGLRSKPVITEGEGSGRASSTEIETPSSIPNVYARRISGADVVHREEEEDLEIPAFLRRQAN